MTAAELITRESALSLLRGVGLTDEWTRDPFDRLLVAHARLRGWKLATSDRVILQHLHPRKVIQL